MTKSNLPTIRSDGFDTYTESVEGREDKASSGGGVYLNFGLDAQWHRSTDKGIMTGTALVLMSIERRCVRRIMVDGKQKTDEVQVISSGPWPNTLPRASALSRKMAPTTTVRCKPHWASRHLQPTEWRRSARWQQWSTRTGKATALIIMW